MNNERGIAAALIASIAGSVLFAVAFVIDARNPATGFGLALAAAGFCVALAAWARAVPAEQVTDAREGEPQRAPAVSRPRLLGLLATAGGALAVAALIPLRSLGARVPLRGSAWRPGARVVREDGQFVRRGDLNVGSVVTAFPEGAPGDTASQIALLRLGPQEMADAQAASRAPEGYAAYSKICTHAGCPVAIYRAAQRQLMCPCHQSLFDVLDGGKVLSGPAARPLPQLPLAFDAQGFLRAAGDFDAPVGPDFWQRS